MESVEVKTLLLVMSVFTGVAAIALIIMACMMLAVYKSANAMRERSQFFMDRWEPVADTSQKTLEEVRGQAGEILEKVKTLADTSQQQVANVDSLLTDVSDGTKRQMQRVDESVQENLKRVQETTEAVQSTVLVPVQQLRAVAAAVNAVIHHLASKPRPTPDKATVDEEMFI